MSESRRTFLRRALLAPSLLATMSALACRPRRGVHGGRSELSADLVIVGGGLGGCAAALAALHRGLRVVMTEETDWVGGQLTQQAVPPDENAWIESIGGTRSYLALRQAVREHYRQHTPLTPRARANPRLNPGNGWVSRLCCEPRVALAVLEAQLAPYVASGALQLLLRHRAVAADVTGDRVRAIAVRDVDTGDQRVLHAPYFADATELGALLPLTGTEYRVGAESQAMTGEPHAKSAYEPDNVQSFTMCFAMDHLPGEDHVIDRPEEYSLPSFDDPTSRRISFDPVARTGFWSYRRILDRDQFAPGTMNSDVTIVNWSQNDYSAGTLIDVPDDVAAQHVSRAKALSLSLLYWLQTEAPRPDGGIGWKGLRLRPDIVGTTDGLAMHPYVRESRRIVAELTVLEQHVTVEGRQRATGLSREGLTAMPYDDSVGIGHYSMDLHLTTRGDRGQYGATLPFQIPLGALLPRRIENLLPAAKNLGVTHLTNGCYRLHPIEWNIGESVGTLVACALAWGESPRGIRHRDALRQRLQAELTRDGVPLAWPNPLPG